MPDAFVFPNTLFLINQVSKGLSNSSFFDIPQNFTAGSTVSGHRHSKDKVSAMQ
jgi:hypothetical protein